MANTNTTAAAVMACFLLHDCLLLSTIGRSDFRVKLSHCSGVKGLFTRLFVIIGNPSIEQTQGQGGTRIQVYTISRV